MIPREAIFRGQWGKTGGGRADINPYNKVVQRFFGRCATEETLTVTITSEKRYVEECTGYIVNGGIAANVPTRKLDTPRRELLFKAQACALFPAKRLGNKAVYIPAVSRSLGCPI